ncbi:MAG: PHP domain-containing protein [Promethearchaeota archaeon]
MTNNYGGLVDLHIHTDASDGTWSNQVLITKLLERNIYFFSITDHNTITNSQLMVHHVNNLKYIPGVEISCMYQDEEFHILGYGFDVNNKDFLNLLEFNQKINKEAHKNLIKKLIPLYSKINYNDYKKYRFNSSRGGWKTLNYFIDIGIIENLTDYYTIIKKTDAWKIPSYKTPEKVVKIIKKANGIPILAHPKVYDLQNFEKLLIEWIVSGVLGIECYHPNLNMDISKKLVTFCRQHDLLISGGSDTHGSFTPIRQLGFPRITQSMIDLGGV